LAHSHPQQSGARSRQRRGERSFSVIELRCDLKWMSRKAAGERKPSSVRATKCFIAALGFVQSRKTGPVGFPHGASIGIPRFAATSGSRRFWLKLSTFATGAAPFVSAPDQGDCDAADTPERRLAELESGLGSRPRGSESRLLSPLNRRSLLTVWSPESRRSFMSSTRCAPRFIVYRWPHLNLAEPAVRDGIERFRPDRTDLPSLVMLTSTRRCLRLRGLPRPTARLTSTASWRAARSQHSGILAWRLLAMGRARVVWTTNFDRVMERAAGRSA
jgi:hypothetical protein